jgi:hypothetical protein
MGLALALAASPAAVEAQTRSRDDAAVRRVQADVAWLAADARGGRGVGTAGLDAAAAHIARRFRDAGLEPAALDYFQEFVIDSTAPAAAHAGLGGATVRNVVGVIPGRGALADQTVVVGAHYDHLGLGGFGSLDPDSTGVIHNGADDNASGTAALIEIARRLAGRDAPNRRTIVVVAFTGEELGLLGSARYVEQPVRPLERTVAMINLDMVGRLRERRLLALGAETAPEFVPLLDSLNRAYAFDLRASGDGWGRSDHASFYGAGIPVLHFFTDTHEQYHRVSDDPETVNATGLAAIAAFTADLVQALASAPGAPTYVEIARPAPVASGERALLGTIPDMSGTPGGVRITGVRAGTPAAAAGLAAGDVILRIGDFDIADLYAMTNALAEYRPGDVVEIVVRRGEETRTFTVTLGRRGG